MPYIERMRRGVDRPLSVGELTYVLTATIEQYRKDHGTSFQTLAEIVGALEQTKDEFQRRVVHRYEDKKIIENGDVYEPVA